MLYSLSDVIKNNDRLSSIDGANLIIEEERAINIMAFLKNRSDFYVYQLSLQFRDKIDELAITDCKSTIECELAPRNSLLSYFVNSKNDIGLPHFSKYLFNNICLVLTEKGGLILYDIISKAIILREVCGSNNLIYNGLMSEELIKNGDDEIVKYNLAVEFFDIYTEITQVTIFSIDCTILGFPVEKSLLSQKLTDEEEKIIKDSFSFESKYFGSEFVSSLLVSQTGLFISSISTYKRNELNSKRNQVYLYNNINNSKIKNTVILSKDEEIVTFLKNQQFYVDNNRYSFDIDIFLRNLFSESLFDAYELKNVFTKFLCQAKTETDKLNDILTERSMSKNQLYSYYKQVLDKLMEEGDNLLTKCCLLLLSLLKEEYFKNNSIVLLIPLPNRVNMFTLRKNLKMCSLNQTNRTLSLWDTVNYSINNLGPVSRKSNFQRVLNSDNDFIKIQKLFYNVLNLRQGYDESNKEIFTNLVQHYTSFVKTNESKEYGCSMSNKALLVTFTKRLYNELKYKPRYEDILEQLLTYRNELVNFQKDFISKGLLKGNERSIIEKLDYDSLSKRRLSIIYAKTASENYIKTLKANLEIFLLTLLIDEIAEKNNIDLYSEAKDNDFEQFIKQKDELINDFHSFVFIYQFFNSYLEDIVQKKILGDQAYVFSNCNSELSINQDICMYIVSQLKIEKNLIIDDFPSLSDLKEISNGVKQFFFPMWDGQKMTKFKNICGYIERTVS